VTKELARQNSARVYYSANNIAVEDFENKVWQKAELIEINRYWSGEFAPKHRHAAARLVWTDEQLFVRFDCEQGETFVVNENPNITVEATELWERDVCEIFVAPNSVEPQRYFEFEIAPTGEWLDFAIHQLPEKRETDKTYHAGMQTATRIGENFFTAVFTIEFERAFGKTPRAGDVWRGNLFRCAGSGETRGYLAWQPTFTQLPSFHVPAVFGYLEFEKK
jgi:hypothetical protein